MGKKGTRRGVRRLVRRPGGGGGSSGSGNNARVKRKKKVGRLDTTKTDFLWKIP